MKDSFILYTAQRAVIDKLSDEQAGKLIKAIYAYAENGLEPDLDPTLDLVFTSFKVALDIDKKKYEETCKARASAGSKGGKQRVANQAKGSKIKQKVANQADYDYEYEYDNELNINSPSAVETSEDDFLHDFEILWSMYPRKEGKADAYKHYKSWRKGKNTPLGKKKINNEQMEFAIKEYCRVLQERGVKDKKFMKMGDTFFNNDILDYLPKEEGTG